GDDRLDGRAGNDLLSDDDGNNTLLGGSGDDTLVGGRHDDRLEGGSGDDVLVFSGGADIFISGAGNDTFLVHFNAQYIDGVATIADFHHGTDHIDAREVFFDFADVLAAATDVGDDVEIALGPHSDLLLEGLHKADLSASDFLF
ncbi:MAG: calcium-binding protein, partial [Bradyrhizobium sp.]|nr:calcium-binding protein [Bradyrhizobium sp.]